MKKALIVGTIVIGAAIAAAAFVLRNANIPVELSVTSDGLKSVLVDNNEVLRDGKFAVDDVTLRGHSSTRSGERTGAWRADAAAQQTVGVFPWGEIAVHYSAGPNRLDLDVVTKNASSSETIEGVRYTPLSFHFPEALREYDGTTPLLAHSLGQVAVVSATYGGYRVAVTNEDVNKPLMVGFPWALNRPKNTEFPLSVHTGRVSSFPDSFPTIARPIAPGASDTFHVSVRFGHKDQTLATVVKDLYAKFAQAYPAELKWTDHRPIGAIFLATPPQHSESNPRGWFGDAAFQATRSPADMRRRLLEAADGSIQIMREMNAQGAIVWDVEGQQFFEDVGYIGDPRAVDKLAPEISSVVDEYFFKFKEAGLLTGVCVRPQSLKVSDDKRGVAQAPVADPTDLLIEKISYAKKRWGVRLIYLDSNTNPADDTPIDASVLKTLMHQFPDTLIIPEHSNLQYYAYSIPYRELRKTQLGTSDEVRAAYPNAFSLIYTADGPLDLYADDLKSSVKHGDIAMYRTWFPDPQNQKVKALYGE